METTAPASETILVFRCSRHPSRGLRDLRPGSLDMKTFEIKATIQVALTRGPEPLAEMVEVALWKLLRSDELLCSVDLPDGAFESAHLEVTDAKLETP